MLNLACSLINGTAHIPLSTLDVTLSVKGRIVGNINFCFKPLPNNCNGKNRSSGISKKSFASFGESNELLQNSALYQAFLSFSDSNSSPATEQIFYEI